MNPPNFSNFTPRALEALSLAREEAIRLGDDYIETEHVLSGIIKLGKGVAINVLEKLGMNLEHVCVEVEKQLGNPPGEKESSDVPRPLKGKLAHSSEDRRLTTAPYAPRTERVFQLAKEEAKGLSHMYIGTEHLLLGLMREGDGMAARVLDKFCVDIEQVRMGILKELDPNFDDGQKG